MTTLARSRAEPVGRLVKECLDRSDEAWNRDLPIILLLGPPGIGRTTVLEEIERRCAPVPHVRLNLDRAERQPGPGRDISPAREILVRTAFGLAEEVPGYRPITFDRLYTCLLVLASELEMNDRIQTLHQITRLLRGQTWAERNRDDIIRIVSPLLASLNLPDVASATVTALASLQWRARLNGWRIWPFRRAERLRRIAERVGPEPLADLVALQSADDDSRQEVERLLMKVFLADLYDGLTTGRQAGSDLFNCVLLLDDVHHSLGGREFLRLLVEERHQRLLERAGTCDPLVVIATSGGWTPVRADISRDRIRPLGEAGYPDWVRGRSGDGREAGSWWYPVALPDFTANDVSVLVKHADLPDRWLRLATDLYRTTDGHPGTTNHILRGLRIAARRRPPEQAEENSRYLLEIESGEIGPGASRRTLGGSALEHWLAPFTELQRKMLVTCAAPRNIEHSSIHAALGRTSDIQNQQALLQNLQENMCARETAGRLELRPVLRRLLLQDLRARPDDDRDSWRRVHGRMRDHYRQPRLSGDLEHATAALYHELAIDELTPVVEHVRTGLATVPPTGRWDGRRWWNELAEITRAPMSPAAMAALSASDPMEGLEAWWRGEADVHVARLILVRWLATKPSAHESALHEAQIPGALDALAAAPEHRHAYDFLLNLAWRYRRGERPSDPL
ncbi:hypothetical protein FDG2_1818 [Candidatus Protofrankia californiensis]|uniref:AAA+ ATPase domain-containing protein n=1 Tax=Candidatus Protofrankia californiensis TaxID=1839754 RepID=A0A1C3NWC9_9ACTN|nr:hypothetical protein FDG2_1818 [Candidatus Protofrankia californiensis]